MIEKYGDEIAALLLRFKKSLRFSFIVCFGKTVNSYYTRAEILSFCLFMDAGLCSAFRNEIENR